MITVEKNTKTDEVVIHAEPEDLRFFAKLLWGISEKAETMGAHSERFSTMDDSEIELSVKPHSDAGTHSVCTTLTISCGST